jgi:hypothetical protein
MQDKSRERAAYRESNQYPARTVFAMAATSEPSDGLYSPLGTVAVSLGLRDRNPVQHQRHAPAKSFVRGDDELPPRIPLGNIPPGMNRVGPRRRKVSRRPYVNRTGFNSDLILASSDQCVEGLWSRMNWWNAQTN